MTRSAGSRSPTAVPTPVTISATTRVAELNGLAPHCAKKKGDPDRPPASNNAPGAAAYRELLHRALLAINRTMMPRLCYGAARSIFAGARQPHRRQQLRIKGRRIADAQTASDDSHAGVLTYSRGPVKSRGTVRPITFGRFPVLSNASAQHIALTRRPGVCCRRAAYPSQIAAHRHWRRHVLPSASNVVGPPLARQEATVSCPATGPVTWRFPATL